MKTRLVVSLLAFATVGFAATPATPSASPATPSPSISPASEASIKELLEVTRARNLIDSVDSQVDGMIKSSMAQALREHPATPEAEKILNGMEQKIMALLNKELSWSILEPMYVRIYQQSFTQHEVDDLLAFYKTPTGGALVNKMPRVMQLSLAEVQQRMRVFMPQAQAISQQTMAELKALEAKQAPAAAKAPEAVPAAPKAAAKP